MAYATESEINEQFQGIVFNKAQAETVLTAASGAEVRIVADPEGDYDGEAGNNVTAKIENEETDGELTVRFNWNDDEIISIEMGDSSHTADEIARAVDDLADFYGILESEGNFEPTDTMTQDLKGGKLQSIVEVALDEASRIVEQYQLMIYGYTDQASSELIDYSRNFNRDLVETGSKLWKVDEYGQKVLVDNQPAEGTIDSVEDHTLTFTPTYSDFQFEADDRYMIEDVARRKKAEVYKACSLLMHNIQTKAEVLQGFEAVRVGEIEADFGDIEEVSSAISNNHFNSLFYTTVGEY